MQDTKAATKRPASVDIAKAGISFAQRETAMNTELALKRQTLDPTFNLSSNPDKIYVIQKPTDDKQPADIRLRKVVSEEEAFNWKKIFNSPSTDAKHQEDVLL